MNSRKSSVVAVADCNNFFVSCERVFNPTLRKQPVIVLSNNDGCVISRSNEAKAIGIQMGQPFFKARHLVEDHGIRVFSGNFKLYGDMSKRVMHILQDFAPDIEFYSIDEAFMDLSDFGRDLDAYARRIRQTVGQWTKIPVSIGIAETKTLAKAAAEIAKQSDRAQGVLNLTGNSYWREKALARLPVRSVWGVGWAIAETLQRARIVTALDLANAEDDWLKRRFNVTFLRTVYELRGIPCFEVDHAPDAKKSIISSRSFADLTSDLSTLKQMVAGYTARAGEKLREEGMAARQVCCFLRTNKHRRDLPQYYNSHLINLAVATQATPQLIAAAHQALERIYRPEFAYYKAGVMLYDLPPADQQQTSLLELDPDSRERWSTLMATVDRLNINQDNLVRLASEGMGQRWRVKKDYRSPDYTSKWEDIPVVRV